MAKTLEQLRLEIDAVDQQILDLLNQRAALASQVAEVKTASQGNNEAPVIFYRPEREAAVLRKIMEHNPGPMPAAESARIFREIMSACLALEQQLHIAFLGPEGTFTQAAALKHFGHSVKTIPLAAIDQVFREVDNGNCHYGVVPVENSTEGVITHTLDMLIDSQLKIVGEVSLRIHHNLLSKEKAFTAIEKVFSHQQSLAQCRHWLARNLPQVEQIAVNSNAEAAKLAARQAGTAAIASSIAAQVYQLDILASHIEDAAENTTRFLILGQQQVGPTPQNDNDCTAENCRDKTSLLVSSANKPGALFHLLEPLEKYNISMNRIESRPAKTGAIWEYVFFIDIEGHIEFPRVRQAIDAMRQQATVLKILGSYPKAVL